MQELVIKSRRNKSLLSVHIGPGSWDELNRESFLLVIKARKLGNDTFQQALVLVKVLFDIPDWYLRKLTTAQAIQLTALVNFAFEEHIKMTRWIFKRLRLNDVVYHGPSDTLGNITMGELMYADDHFRRYQKTRKIDYLNKLIAVLYRKRGSAEWFDKTGDRREPFNAAHLDRNSAVFSVLEEEIKQAILVNYIGCRSEMASLFKHVFPDSISNEEEDKPATNGGWLDVVIQLARKEHALGSIDDVEEHNAYLTLRVLDKVIQEHEELEEIYNRNKA